MNYFLIMKNFLKDYFISKLNLINVFFIIFGFILSNIESKAHLRGYFSTQKEAKEKAKEFGCVGTFKLNKMWMPCENEKELHKFLRKK